MPITITWKLWQDIKNGIYKNLLKVSVGCCLEVTNTHFKIVVFI
jgi:hypothetical protein